MRNHKLVALLLFCLSYLTICLSAPTNSLVSPSDQTPRRISLTRSLTSGQRHGLAKREDANYQQFLSDLASATRVDQDDEKFLGFGMTPAILASDGFVGCIGVIIASSQGAIIGHYTNTDSGMSRARSNLVSLITSNKKALAGAKAWIYAHVSLQDTNTFTSETNNQVLEGIVGDNLGITPARVKYIEPEDLLVDEQGELLDEYPEDIIYGGVMAKHPGQQSTETQVIFINLDWQKAAAENSMPSS